jgi:vanillate O-demethylase monooxygenase subunit
VLAEPVRVVLLGAPWVLWRDGSGHVAALEDRCPHRRAPLSLGSVVDGTLQCSYHGWRFGGDGGCVDIPALGEGATIPSRACATAPWGVEESHGMIFLALEEPVTPLPTLEEADDDSFMVGDLPAITTRGSAALLADNFLDMAHFPFVHVGTFGAEEARFVDPYEVVRDGYSSTVVITHAFANREDPGVDEGIRPLIQQRRLTYRFSAPFHLALRIDYLDAGGTNTIGFFICPQDAETTRIYSTLWRNDLGGDEQRMQDAVDFEIAVVEEDLRLQSRYDLLSVPLDITEEVHTRVDKTTIEMRRILRDLVEATEEP